eukprot:CAMPEP_0196731642 /NCGR_PEP_ID=MMETSP1091-20130531/11283_1 /TAXON_ID=302021 /ORGANISM="Rhodomonas sp., Strain CCMP768" /LENGTH=224 /DNA_ID=CAMNT_0042074791 /DNA_START=9 /DNA_END=683 /DNA_ORIENTATION=+
MAEYGAVAPSSMMGSSRSPPSSSSWRNSPAAAFLAILSSAIVLTVLLGADSSSVNRAKMSLAASQTMTAMATQHSQQGVQQQAARPVRKQAVSPAPVQPVMPPHQNLQEEGEGEEAPAEEAPAKEEEGSEGDDKSVVSEVIPDDMVPKKVEGGTARQAVTSVEEAVSEKPDKKNSHYVHGYSDKGVHLIMIIFLLGGVTVILYLWKQGKEGKGGDKAEMSAQKV